jgi:hypothetical protein
MSLFGGDKNSPKTSASTASTTTNKQNQSNITTGANSAVSNTALSDLTLTNSKINVTSTDQGAIAAGLQIALRSLDNANSELKTVAGTSQSAIDAATSVATTAAQGQQNTSLKYIITGVVAVGALVVAYAYFSRRG